MMKRKESNFDDFKKNQLTAEARKSVSGGRPPVSVPPILDVEWEEGEPQWGGPIVLANTGGVKNNDNGSQVILLP